MSGPDDLPEAEHPGSQSNRSSNQGSDQRDFQSFHGSSSVVGYEQKPQFRSTRIRYFAVNPGGSPYFGALLPEKLDR
jgi:hypothetical protein